MEQWTPNVWFAICAAFFVGIIVGCAVVRALKGNVKQHIQLETELKATKEQVEAQKQQLEQHFEQSAALLSTLAEDYKKLYTHLAKGSEMLVPEAKQVEFFKQPQLTDNAKNVSDDQPRDYSEGSSGLLKTQS
ncbi:YhcB family protein [Actinobacillus arthritidis]|uniref:YhcB family protein n=1 Tax=Actinobacillus arthritidis TaxID=157339 RepID=UPI002442F2BB|nr:YhcB family protein [Actinobacillus arthritidis]WGE89926.1 YhcB family protein [Actinobacillus arthritidis]